jgi:hypothetical protein
MIHDTRKQTKYYWRSWEFKLGPPTNNTVILCGPDFDTEEEARRHAETTVRRLTRRWPDSLGGTSKYTIKMEDSKED